MWLNYQLVSDENITPYIDGLALPSVDTNKFQKALQDLRCLPTGLLPTTVRWMSPSRRMVILERPPHMQRVSFRRAKPYNITPKTREHVFEIPLPWTLYAISLGTDCYPESISLYARPSPIVTGREYLGLLPLLNFYFNGALCMPPRNEYSLNLHTVADGLAAASSIIWDAGFNLDLNQALLYCSQYKTPNALFESIKGKVTPYRILKAWQEFSLKDVVSWPSWLRPSAYEAANAHYLGNRYDHVVSLMQDLEAQRTINNPAFNVILTLKEAVTKAST